MEFSTGILRLMVVGTLVTLAGCHSNHVEDPVTADDVVAEIDRLEQAVRSMPPGATDAALHALNSGDPTIRAQAAMSLGKSKRLTHLISEQLENLALHEVDPFVRAAALSALYEHGQPSREIIELSEQLRNDPQLGLIASRLRSDL